jgi:hypothetical protein
MADREGEEEEEELFNDTMDDAACSVDNVKGGAGKECMRE